MSIRVPVIEESHPANNCPAQNHLGRSQDTKEWFLVNEYDLPARSAGKL